MLPVKPFKNERAAKIIPPARCGQDGARPSVRRNDSEALLLTLPLQWLEPMTFRHRCFRPSWPGLSRPSVAAPVWEEMAGSSVQFGDMADTCSETWLTPQLVVKSIAPIRCAPKKMP
jgi:hypothetical protein